METLGKALTRLQGYQRTEARDVAIFLLLLDCGLRPGEIVNICLQDINWVENRIMVDGKTGQRIVPFSPKTRRTLQAYLKVCKREEGEDTLFLSKTGEPLNRNALRLIFMRLKERMKLPNRFYPYLLRHTSATYHSINGSNLEAVRMMLGHTSYEMTRNYLSLASLDLARAHRRSSPVEKL